VKAMADEDAVEYLKNLGEKLGEHDKVLNSIAGKISKIEKEQEGKLPMYLAKNPQEMHDQLEKMGWFTPKEEGLQDDFANAFRMFTEVNDRGDLIPGLKPSLISLYQTMDLRGLIWNYGLGWISALKGGYNAGIESAKGEGKKKVEEIFKRCVEDANMGLNMTQTALDYTKSVDDLEYYINNRSLIKNLKQVELLSNLAKSKRPSTKKATYYGVKKNKKEKPALSGNLQYILVFGQQNKKGKKSYLEFDKDYKPIVQLNGKHKIKHITSFEND